MRKITNEATKAFLNITDYKNGNTMVTNCNMYLHGNLIATKVDNDIYVSNANWATNTTKERLNGILSLCGKSPIFQKNGQWYYKNIFGDKFPFPTDIFVNIADFEVVQ